MHLDDSQRETIERNRQEALRRLEERRQRLSANSSVAEPSRDTTGVSGLIPTARLVPVNDGGMTSAAAPIKRPSSFLYNTQLQAKNARTAGTKDSHPHAAKKGAAAARPQLNIQLHRPESVSITDTDAVREACQGMAQVTSSPTDGLLIVPLSQLSAIIERLPASDRPLPQNTIPRTILAAFEPSQMHQRQVALAANLRLEDSIDANLYEALFPFQKEGVRTAIARRGRIMFADEMGLGKSIQAIATAVYFRREWPLLILAPASMVASWHEQILRWLPSVPPQEISVIYDGKVTAIDGLVTILSYDLAVKLIGLIKRRTYRVIIADECHALRNADTKRSKTLIPLLKDAERAIMLSGTPALSRPVELYPQIQAINQRLFPKFHEYGLRYCAGRHGHFGWDWRGASNLKELQIILEQCIMIRRMKSEVMTQLPRKIRHQIFLKLPIGSKSYKMFQMQATELLSPHLQAPGTEDSELDTFQKKAEYMALWKLTAELKLPAMLEYVEDLLEAGHKMLIFAHHQSVLDGFQTHFVAKNMAFMRIDGRTPPSERQNICSSFQTDDRIRIALLSITAASTGLTLTKATTVIFAELFFNPGVLVQAEDRAHRIGQMDSVNVHYLLAKNTTDDRIWPLILRKLTTLESVGLGRNDFKDIVSREHDQSQLTLDRCWARTTAVVAKTEAIDLTADSFSE